MWRLVHMLKLLELNFSIRVLKGCLLMNIIITHKVKYTYDISKHITITSLFMFGWIFFKILKMKTKIRWAYDQVTQVFVAMIIIRLHWMSLRHRYYGVLSILKWEHLYRFCSFGSQLWHLFACLPNGYWIHTCLRKLSFCESMLIFAALKWTPSSRVAFLQRRLNSWKCMINVSQFL